MSYVTLEMAKAHLALFHDGDDALVQQCLDASEAHCADIMNRESIVDVQPAGKEWLSVPDDVVPPTVVQGVLMYMAEFYEQRTAGVTGTIYSKLPNATALLHFQRLSLGI